MISVDKVYQKVLALANKEQRGYITPQEFNLFADHAQMEIFEQYFYDLEQRQRAPGNELDYADMVTNLEEKISMFEISNQAVGLQTEGEVYISSDIPDFYRLGNVSVAYSGGHKINADKIQLNELNNYRNAPLAKWAKTRPVYSKFSTSITPVVIKIYPQMDQMSVSISYIRKPKKPNWTYLIGSSRNALYNPSASDHNDFELHNSEENDLVLKILQLAGISIKDLQLAGVATQQEMKTLQQEKQ
tara:strand:+ start:54 stop:788 length:735 start_codon:yes stop_codon:yes gene_type:complete